MDKVNPVYLNISINRTRMTLITRFLKTGSFSIRAIRGIRLPKTLKII